MEKSVLPIRPTVHFLIDISIFASALQNNFNHTIASAAVEAFYDFDIDLFTEKQTPQGFFVCLGAVAKSDFINVQVIGYWTLTLFYLNAIRFRHQLLQHFSLRVFLKKAI